MKAIKDKRSIDHSIFVSDPEFEIIAFIMEVGIMSG